jgi:ribosomal protein L29
MAKKKKEVPYRELSDADLSVKLNDMKKAIQETRFNLVTGSVNNTKSIRTNKRDIARILTELNKRKKVS